MNQESASDLENITGTETDDGTERINQVRQSCEENSQRYSDERSSSLAKPILRDSLGTLVFILGVAIGVLSLISHSHGLPFQMPRYWNQNLPLWILIGLGMSLGGLYQLKKSSQTWSTAVDGVRFRSVTIYTRTSCHLCDEALEVLLQFQEYLPEIKKIDIEDDVELEERYGTSIPVVVIDGRERFRGRVNEILLKRLIEATPPLHF